jgi:hypothetical protein
MDFDRQSRIVEIAARAYDQSPERINQDRIKAWEILEELNLGVNEYTPWFDTSVLASGTFVGTRIRRYEHDGNDSYNRYAVEVGAAREPLGSGVVNVIQEIANLNNTLGHDIPEINAHTTPEEEILFTIQRAGELDPA